MHFDDAFAILVEHCVQISQALSNAYDHYGNDIWIAGIVRSHWASKTDPNSLTDEHYLPLYDAAWELCRIGVLRAGPHAPTGQGQIGGGIYSGDGYSITELGAGWLGNPDRRVSADPSRMAEIFAAFVGQQA
jgi:hypothetical protein